MNPQVEILERLMEKEIKITIPEGYEIDKENSTFECIKLKKKTERWINKTKSITGFYINSESEIMQALCANDDKSRNVFATRKQAESARAMAQISQIIEHDERFGGPITDEEWRRPNFDKYILYRCGEKILTSSTISREYYPLAFHTKEQRDLFLEENENLVKDYLMIE